MRLPISESEEGGVYPIGKDNAMFFPVNGHYYQSLMKGKDFKVMSFKSFKQIYPYHIGNNYYTKKV